MRGFDYAPDTLIGVARKSSGNNSPAFIAAIMLEPLKKHWRLPKATLTQQLPPQTERPDKPLNKSELPQKDKC
jgi:hypothetical protein